MHFRYFPYVFVPRALYATAGSYILEILQISENFNYTDFKDLRPSYRTLKCHVERPRSPKRQERSETTIYFSHMGQGVA